MSKYNSFRVSGGNSVFRGVMCAKFQSPKDHLTSSNHGSSYPGTRLLAMFAFTRVVLRIHITLPI